jgi:hypothetical protein
VGAGRLTSVRGEGLSLVAPCRMTRRVPVAWSSAQTGWQAAQRRCTGLKAAITEAIDTVRRCRARATHPWGGRRHRGCGSGRPRTVRSDDGDGLVADHGADADPKAPHSAAITRQSPAEEITPTSPPTPARGPTKASLRPQHGERGGAERRLFGLKTSSTNAKNNGPTQSRLGACAVKSRSRRSTPLPASGSGSGLTPRPAAALGFPDPVLGDQPFDRATSDPVPLAHQLFVDLPRAVARVVGLVHAADLRRQPFVADRAIGPLAGRPLIVGGR